MFCSCCVWHVNLFCYHHLITWYCPLHMNPVHSLFTAQSACPWFCNGSVRFSSLPHIWHSARCRFSSKLVTHESCWMIMTIETTRLNDFILLFILLCIFLRWKDIFLLRFVVVDGIGNISYKLCSRDDGNFFLLSLIWIFDESIFWFVACLNYSCKYNIMMYMNSLYFTIHNEECRTLIIIVDLRNALCSNKFQTTKQRFEDYCKYCLIMKYFQWRCNCI